MKSSYKIPGSTKYTIEIPDADLDHAHVSVVLSRSSDSRQYHVPLALVLKFAEKHAKSTETDLDRAFATLKQYMKPGTP